MRFAPRDGASPAGRPGAADRGRPAAWRAQRRRGMLPGTMAGPEERRPSAFDTRLRALFEAALQLPGDERDAFVARAAGDDAALRERATALLRHADAATPRLDPGIAAPGEPATRERVQSTQTAEMLRRLERAPRLDTERYRIEGEVDRGGMGAILQIHDGHLNRRLAMKVLLEQPTPRSDYQQKLVHQLLGRFLEEAQVTSQLDHPGVVPVHELGLDEHGKIYFTMRLVRGRAADEVFAEAHRGSDDWPLTRALEVILKVCDTMAFAHDRGVLHRDLKPANVMVGRFGEVYVMDWGLAKVLGQEDRRDLRIRPEPGRAATAVESARRRDADSDDGSSVVSMDGQKLGTPSYMPPEQAKSEPLDVRADVYAIGAMLYELLTGRAPYTTPGVHKAAYRILDDVVDGPPKRVEELQKGVPAELVAIVDKAMARDREQRYPDTVALAHDLRAFLAQRAVKAYRTGPIVELELWVRRNKALAASLAAAVLILLAGVAGTSAYAREANRLLREKTELAAAETRATEDALLQKRRAAEAAATNAQLAQEKSELADAEGKAKAAAQRTVRDFNQLAGVVRLEDARRREQELWPDWPDRIDAMAAWLRDDADRLLAMRPQIEVTVTELRARSLPWTAEQQAADRRAAPRWPAYERQRRWVDAERRVQAIRDGRQPLVVPELTPEQQALDAEALNTFAWTRIAPQAEDGGAGRRRTFGEEHAGLAFARAAVAKAGDPLSECKYLDTLAWAALANGQDAEARQRIAEVVAKVPPADRELFLGRQRDIETAITDAAARLAAAEARLAELQAEVDVRRTWQFGDDAEGVSARFLHTALADLLDRLSSFEAQEKADVERRLRWAKLLAEPCPPHAARWARARAAIAAADDVVASRRYAGRTIPLRDDELFGLVPIGMNPATKLWEFYDLRSAWDGERPIAAIPIPEHGTDGAIAVAADTGIVFVLLPGGTFHIGAQRDDPNAPNYDPQAEGNEGPVQQVTLDPFLIARHELTKGQWLRLTGRTDSGYRLQPNYPVEDVTWTVAEQWLRRWLLDLPTEAQWEYACRAGTDTPWWTGTDAASLATAENLRDATSKATYQRPGTDYEPWSDGFFLYGPVGSLGPNAFGLHDMLGNVGEWCQDKHAPYDEYPVVDRNGTRTDSPYLNRIMRGASFNDLARSARCAARSSSRPTEQSPTKGFRAVLRLDGRRRGDPPTRPR